MRRFIENTILLTLFEICLLVAALPSVQNANIAVDDDNRWDESDNSGGKVPERFQRINERKLVGRENVVQSKCGYEVGMVELPGYCFRLRYCFFPRPSVLPETASWNAQRSFSGSYT